MTRARKPVSKTELLARMPLALRPKLPPDQVLDIGLVHIMNLDDIAKGNATEETLWHLVEAVLTWSRAAEVLQRYLPEMEAQLQLASRMVERFGSTGRVAFTGVDYQLAKEGVRVMDALAAIVDRATALGATAWSRARVLELNAACAQRVAAAAERKAA